MFIQEVAKRVNISKRTIRYYEELGLIEVYTNKDNGYRVYNEAHINVLQQIRYWRSLKVPLKDMQQLLKDENDKVQLYLKAHMKNLQLEQQQLHDVIEQIKMTLKKLEGTMMSSRFEQEKQQWIEKNEAQYGEEIRQRHGEESVMASYGKLKELTEEQQQAAQGLEQTLFERLKEAMEEETPELMLEIAEVHKRWLSFYWPKYTKQTHVGLAQLYVTDERFTSYYDEAVGDGATELLYEAIEAYSKL